MSRIREGKIAVITGGTSGLGLATAKLFVQEGATVYITGRRQAQLDKATRDIGPGVYAVRADSSKRMIDLKSRCIRVNVISPGAIETPGLKAAAPNEKAADAMLVHFAGLIPAGRVGSSADIAKAALFLASDAAGYINGADLQVDGGWGQV